MNTSDLLKAANKHYEEYSAYVYNQFSNRKEGTKFIKRTIYMSLAADKELTHGEVLLSILSGVLTGLIRSSMIM